ncbi:hypothetical protein B296_00020256 [Ensete ventricosum]|uniref:Tryptophan synthase beta chain-like PALP domain-containing protein n=1 Tax=Ensete ventricosum TaxID=4639 RepID=A0A426ZAL0_ENSVE|nr:hypothetical protein B296_00020256 [Ensete ventricosum]
MTIWNYILLSKTISSSYTPSRYSSTVFYILKLISSFSSQAKGLGYAMNTAEELQFVKDVAAATGVVLDPVYSVSEMRIVVAKHHDSTYLTSLYLVLFFFFSGKAAYGMLRDMTENPTKWKKRKVLFVHTGGLLGLYDKVEQMTSLVGNWQKLEIDEAIPRKDGTGKMF